LNKSFIIDIKKPQFKPKIDINQLIESHSTQGLTISHKILDDLNSYNEFKPFQPQSSDRTPLNQIELGLYKENPNINLISARNEPNELLLIHPDSSLLALNPNANASQVNLSNINIQSPRSQSENKKKYDENPFNTFTPNNNNQKTHDFFYHESHFIKDLYRGNTDFNLDSLFEALTLCQASKTLGFFLNKSQKPIKIFIKRTY